MINLIFSVPPLSSVIARVDDAVEYVADRLQSPIRAFSAGSPASRRSPTLVEVSAEWICARCSEVNQPAEMHCVRCNFQRGAGKSADVTAGVNRVIVFEDNEKIFSPSFALIND